MIRELARSPARSPPALRVSNSVRGVLRTYFRYWGVGSTIMSYLEAFGADARHKRGLFLRLPVFSFLLYANVQLYMPGVSAWRISDQ